MADLPVIIDHLGQERKLARTLPTDTHRKMRASMTSFTSYLDSIGKKLSDFPMSSWKPISRRKRFDVQQYLVDQLKYGACVFASCVKDFQKTRVLQGMSFQKLSWAYGYDQINGGHDNGACITDAALVISGGGCPLYADYDPVPQFNTRKQPDSRSRFRLAKYYTFGSWLEGCVAQQLGFLVQYPVQVGQNYGNFDSDGCCGFSNGPGNHSVSSDGMAYVGNRWLWDHDGTWGLWGPWQNGRAYHSQQMVDGCAIADDAYILVDAYSDPQDTNNP